jgi:hypothetical protein
LVPSGKNVSDIHGTKPASLEFLESLLFCDVLVANNLEAGGRKYERS